MQHGGSWPALEEVPGALEVQYASLPVPPSQDMQPAGDEECKALVSEEALVRHDMQQEWLATMVKLMWELMQEQVAVAAVEEVPHAPLGLAGPASRGLW